MKKRFSITSVWTLALIALIVLVLEIYGAASANKPPSIGENRYIFANTLLIEDNYNTILHLQAISTPVETPMPAQLYQKVNNVNLP